MLCKAIVDMQDGRTFLSFSFEGIQAALIKIVTLNFLNFLNFLFPKNQLCKLLYVFEIWPVFMMNNLVNHPIKQICKAIDSMQ